MFTPLLHYQLTGSTCYISRIKNHQHNIGFQTFMTFHSITYKILRCTTIGNNLENLHEQLVGSEMKSLVSVTLTKLFNKIPAEDQVNSYYLILRQHLNGKKNIKTIEHGQQFLTMYMQIKDEGLDWEESLQLATYYLNNNHVDKIDGFKFNNVILLNVDVLNYPSNKNAKLFFKALCDWNAKRNAFNLYEEQGGSFQPLQLQQVRVQNPMQLNNQYYQP